MEKYGVVDPGTTPTTKQTLKAAKVQPRCRCCSLKASAARMEQLDELDDDAAKRTMNGNSWASTIPGMIDHNEWDIVWNSATYGFPNYHDSIVKVSEDNYGAYILDLRRDKDAIVKDLVTTHPQ